MPAWLDAILQGPTAVAMVVGLLAAFALVENLLVQRGVVWAYGPWLPCGASLPPLRATPGEGGTACGIGWRRLSDGRVVWRAEGRGLPRGMRGLAHLRVDRRGQVHVEVTWTAWWVPWFAGVVLAVLGGLRGDGPVAGGLATLVLFGTTLAYGSQAVRAAAAVRQAMVVSGEADADQGVSGGS